MGCGGRKWGLKSAQNDTRRPLTVCERLRPTVHFTAEGAASDSTQAYLCETLLRLESQLLERGCTQPAWAGLSDTRAVGDTRAVAARVRWVAAVQRAAVLPSASLAAARLASCSALTLHS